MAAYNASATLSETIESVLGQTRGDWELVIVDDGSTDDTRAIAERFASADERILLVTQVNTGTAGARNAGFAAANGGWLCILDADDLLLPTFLERMAAFSAAHEGYDIYSSNGSLLLRTGGEAPLWQGRGWDRVREVTVVDEIAESSIPVVSLMRRAVVDLTGGFRDLYSEDYDFWLRALILGARHLHNPEVLWRYRRHAGSKTTALVAEAESILRILTDARAMPELTEAQRIKADEAVAFARARIGRRRLEEALLRGEYEGARRAYLRYRRAFPDRFKYALGLVLMTLSPALYARIKARRFV